MKGRAMLVFQAKESKDLKPKTPSEERGVKNTLWDFLGERNKGKIRTTRIGCF